MTKNNTFDALKAFAEQALAAHKYPHDTHIFKLFACDRCGAAPFSLLIEHHTGSNQNDFKGVIRGTCARCGAEKQLFSFTGVHRQKIRTENPHCSCGHSTFHTGECERIEGDEGLQGFFDEGVIVGTCASCGKRRVFVFTD